MVTGDHVLGCLGEFVSRLVMGLLGLVMGCFGGFFGYRDLKSTDHPVNIRSLT